MDATSKSKEGDRVNEIVKETGDLESKDDADDDDITHVMENDEK